MPDPQQYEDQESGSYEAYFRDPSLATEAPLAWALQQRLDVVEALRGLFGGAPALARLRLWCFLTLASAPAGPAVARGRQPAVPRAAARAAGQALKRLRDLGPAGVGRHRAGLPPLAARPPGAGAAGAAHHGRAAGRRRLASLLAQVAGAQQLGVVDASQLQHLHAQLARLHDEFADAIASGSESRLRLAQPRFDRALALVDRAGQALSAIIERPPGQRRGWRRPPARSARTRRGCSSMASQFTRALQQADRQRVTLGSTGLTSSDVRRWLQHHAALHTLLGDALSRGRAPGVREPARPGRRGRGRTRARPPRPARSTGPAACRPGRRAGRWTS